MIQPRSTKPVIRNAPRHHSRDQKTAREEKVVITNGSPKGTRIPPTLQPELNRPVARAAFAFWKPFGGSFNGGGKIAAFAQPEQNAHDEKSRNGADQGMAHGREPPERTGHGESPAQAKDIHHPPGQQKG